MNKLILLVGMILFFVSASDADEKEDPCHYSTEGVDFWFGLMQNRSNYPEHYLEITVTSRFGADFTLTYGPGEVPIGNGSYSVAANSSVIVPIPYQLLESMGSGSVEEKGIHLAANNPVNVYALNYRRQSSDVAVIYPTESLGTEYFAMCYTPPAGNSEKNTQFLIVAAENKTTVTITPTMNTASNQLAGKPFSVVLNKGESYQIQSFNSNIAGQGDLTGSYVSADKPIAFFSGAKASPVPMTGTSYDHLFEQIPPTSTWGRLFYMVPLALRTKDTYRVLAAEDATVITIEGINRIITLNRGQYFEFELGQNQASRLISTKRVLLAQYCRSQNIDNNGVGDPFMIILSPITQKINDVTFEAYKSALIQDIFYVNIISQTAETGNILLDEVPIGIYFKPFPKGEYSYAQIRITGGPHRLRNINKNEGFLAFVYGFGDRTESYGYGVGYNLDIQLELEKDFGSGELVICKGESRKLDAGTYFSSYKWNTGETSSVILVSKEGWYKVTARTSSGCEKSDSVFVKVEEPKLYLGEDAEVCHPGDVVLDAGDGFESYLWQDGSTNRTFVVPKSGDYIVTATNMRGCKATDTIHVTVFEATFSQNFEVASDAHPAISFYNESINSVDWFWDFGDGFSGNSENPVHNYSAVGRYQVVFQATSKFGCVDTISSWVKIIPFNLLAPNAFRPDSDIPENRIFIPISEGIDPEKYRLRIINRVGSTVFESQNPEIGWNGKVKSGTLAEPGLFIWLVEYADVQGFRHQQKGTVMLVR